MTLSLQERMAIVGLKQEKSRRTFDEMLANYQMGLYSTSANRLYYAIFYAISALLVHSGFEANTHKGNLAVMEMLFIRTGLVDSKFSKIIGDIFNLRQNSDYDDYFNVGKEDITRYIEPVRELMSRIDELIAE